MAFTDRELPERLLSVFVAEQLQRKDHVQGSNLVQNAETDLVVHLRMVVGN